MGRKFIGFVLLSPCIFIKNLYHFSTAVDIGIVIAITGTYARTRLRATRDFIDAKQQVKNSFSKANMDIKILENDPIWKKKVNWKTSVSYFLIQCS
ncbi:hypothetical protein [Rickettsia endosymbiont of Gonocerus acuteangulatus]|uniref:hypothetical protein n=1 Tax=Rickettsia endosymbiont of Gonocerus acuteangulatus TaxID=3066266 RepID=UPI003132D847